MNKQDIIIKAKQLKEQIETNEKELQGLFLNDLKEFLQKYPDIKEIQVYINNHEFNDGEPTYFSVNWDSALFITKDGEIRIDEIKYGDDNKEYKPIVAEFYKIFEDFEPLLNFESFWGECYESISISLDKNGELKVK
jgi:hypothetical protein